MYIAEVMFSSFLAYFSGVFVTNFAKPATYTHYGKEQFSLSMDTFINKIN